MNREITVNKKIYQIKGCWDNHLAIKWFKGTVYDVENEEIIDLDFRIPLSAIVKYGLEYFETCIVEDLKKEIKDLELLE